MVVDGRDEEVAAAFGRRLGDEHVTGDVAMAGSLRGEPAVAQIGNWTLVVDPGLTIVHGGEPETLRSFGTVVTATILDVSDSIVVEIRRDDRVRSIVASEHQILLESGEPMAEERGLTWTDVDYVIVLLDRLTGIRLDSSHVAEAVDFRRLETA